MLCRLWNQAPGALINKLGCFDEKTLLYAIYSVVFFRSSKLHFVSQTFKVSLTKQLSVIFLATYNKEPLPYPFIVVLPFNRRINNRNIFL